METMHFLKVDWLELDALGFIEITIFFTSVLKADSGRRVSVIGVPREDEMSTWGGWDENMSHGIVQSKKSATCSVGISAIDLIVSSVSNKKKVPSPSISVKE